MKKILSLLALMMLCVTGANAEKVIYSWPSDASQANSITLAEGVTVAITGNTSKSIQSANKITVNGTEYTSMKVSNGAQNTLTLPKEAIGITFYSYVNKDAATDRAPYWKEVAGVEYTEETSGGTMTSYKDGANPDIRSFSFEATKEITFTNTGEQLCYVMEVEYAEEVEPVSTTKTIGLVPGPWVADNATFAAYVWDGEGNAWFPFVEVSGAYATQIPENFTGLILARINPEGTDDDPWKNVWNQTDDIDFTAIADGTIFTITGWGEGENAKSTYTAGTDLDIAKAEFQAAIDEVSAYNMAGLADAIAAAQAAVDAEDATIESLQTAADTFEATVKAYVKGYLQKAVPMVESLNAADLATSIAAAKTALGNEDATAKDLATALLGLLTNARPYIITIMGQTVEVCNLLGIETTAAQALLDKGDEASTIDLANALLRLTETAVPAAKEVLNTLKAYMTTFSSAAAVALKDDFATLEQDINNGNIAAVKADIVTLMTKAAPYLKTDIEKLEVYATVINNEAITADVAAMKAAVEEGKFAELLAAVKKFETDFLTAAPDFVSTIKSAVVAYKKAGKTNGIEELEAAVTAAETALGAEDRTIVTVGLAIRNLVLAVQAFEEANTTYTVAGTPDAIFGTAWDTTNTANDMTKGADGIWTKVYENVALEAVTIEYKVVKNHSWDESYGFGGENATYEIKSAGTAETITFTFDPNAEGNKVSCTVKMADSDLMAQARALAAEDGVAVGKLLQAIEYAEAGDETGLQAAIDQYKEDNKDQEKDETAKVATNGWKKYDGTSAGVCATQFAPAITTYDGRTAQLAEVFENNGNRTGTIIYQDITGLTNGKYKVGFYGNAFSTSVRDGFECTMEEGADDVAYVFANDQKAYITAHIATSTTENDFRQFDVEVTDGAIKLGMGKDTEKSTNWHTMQIYQLTWFTTAKEVFAQDQTELKALLVEAKDLLADEYKTNSKDGLEFVVNAAEQGVDSKMINITELEALIGNLKSAIAQFNEANYFIDFAAGEYYIIDAETDLKMAAGNNYGTRGIVNELGLDLTLTPYTESRTVTIDSRVSNGGNNHFLGQNLYMDGSEWGWALEYRGFGFYILDPNTQKYINIDENNNLVLSDTPREWIIVTKEGVMEERLEELKAATAEAPVDATFLLTAPNFNRNDARNAEAWVKEQTLTGDGHTTNLSGGKDDNNCAEAYHTGFSFKQTITGAPAGLYKLTAQGFYRQDGENAEDAPVFFIGTKNGEVPVKTGSENNMSQASESFTNRLYTIEPIEFKFYGGDLEIGVKGTGENQWVIFDNFQLEYCGLFESTYTLVGGVGTTEGGVEGDVIFTKTWDPEVTANNFDQSELDNETGTYTKVFSDVELTPGSTIYYKVVADGDWDYNWGFDGNNAEYVVNLPEGETLPNKRTTGIFDITFKFNPFVLLGNGYNVECEVLYDSETTGICTIVAAEAQNGNVYNLNGQKVQSLKKGLYIVNGKKQVVR